MEDRTKMGRNPLQRLNGVQIHKSKSSNLSSSSSSSSSSASVFLESPNGGSRFSLSLNPCSSRTPLQRKPRNVLPLSNSAPLKSSAVTLKPRSKENELPKIPFSEKSMKNQRLRLDKKGCGEPNRKPTIGNGQRPKLYSAQSNPLKTVKKVSTNSEGNGSREVPIKLFVESTKRINSNWIGFCTPDGKAPIPCSLDSVGNINDDPISKTDVKTPPVEASVSPEMQYGFHSKLTVLNSIATPVCYGASHLLSGVTDKRKCRRRGSLKGGCEKVNFFPDENNCENGSIDSWDNSVPLPSEASVRWLSSPCHEDLENKEMHEHLLVVTTPNPVSNLNSVIGNIIHTPSSGPSSGSYRGSEADLVQFDLDSILESINKAGPSPSSVGLQSADMDLSSSIGLSQVHENAKSGCSWVSDSTVENLALSQTRVSWRDGFFRSIDENDELDCCRCLSDEEIEDNRGSGGDGEIDLAISSSLRSRCGTESRENDTLIYKDGHEPLISAQGNLQLSPHRLDESAESICTNGDGFVASGGSDWMHK